MMNPVEKMLKNAPVMILDGAMATELEAKGCDLNDHLWSAKVLMESPEQIQQVHMDYFKAGADCAITASYQATIDGFKQRGMNEEEAIDLIQQSVVIACEVRDAFWSNTDNQTNRLKPLVAASVGPYGAFLADGSEYRGNYSLTEDELVAFHRPRMKALIEAGADLLACETIPCLLEAKAIVRVLKEFSGTYAWISFSAKDALHISNGDSIAQCAEWLDSIEQVAAVGINCTAPEYIESLIREMKKNTEKPIIVYPNLGKIYNPIDKTWETASSTGNYGQSARQWYEAGATVIGGCCQTKPKDIQAITDWVRK